MDVLLRLLEAVLPAAWTATGALYLHAFLQGGARAARAARVALAATLVLHGADFVVVGLSGVPPVASVAGLVSAVAFTMGTVHLVLERRAGTATVGVFPVAIGTVLTITSVAIGDPLRPIAPELVHWSTALHVGSALMGYAAVFTAAVYGALFLLQRRALLERRFGLIWERLPSIELLDGFSRGSLLAGFVLLTATIGMGHAARSATELTGTYWDPKILFTNGLWLLIGLVVLGRAVNRLRPSVSAWATLGLLVLAVFNMAVMSRLSEVHSQF